MKGEKTTLSSEKGARQGAKIPKLDKEKMQNKVIKINPDIPLINTNIGKIKFIIKREIVSDWINKATNKHRCRKLRYT